MSPSTQAHTPHTLTLHTHTHTTHTHTPHTFTHTHTPHTHIHPHTTHTHTPHTPHSPHTLTHSHITHTHTHTTHTLTHHTHTHHIHSHTIHTHTPHNTYTHTPHTHNTYTTHTHTHTHTLTHTRSHTHTLTHTHAHAAHSRRGLGGRALCPSQQALLPSLRPTRLPPLLPPCRPPSGTHEPPQSLAPLSGQEGRGSSCCSGGGAPRGREGWPGPQQRRRPCGLGKPLVNTDGGGLLLWGSDSRRQAASRAPSHLRRGPCVAAGLGAFSACASAPRAPPLRWAGRGPGGHPGLVSGSPGLPLGPAGRLFDARPVRPLSSTPGSPTPTQPRHTRPDLSQGCSQAWGDKPGPGQPAGAKPPAVWGSQPPDPPRRPPFIPWGLPGNCPLQPCTLLVAGRRERPLRKPSLGWLNPPAAVPTPRGVLITFVAPELCGSNTLPPRVTSSKPPSRPACVTDRAGPPQRPRPLPPTSTALTTADRPRGGSAPSPTLTPPAPRPRLCLPCSASRSAQLFRESLVSEGSGTAA